MLVIVVLQQWQHEERLTVLAKIRRYVADPQAPVRRAIQVEMGGPPRGERSGVGDLPRSRFRQDRPGIVRGMKVEMKQEIAVIGRVLRPRGYGRSKRGDRLLQPSTAEQGVGDLVMRVR